MPVNFSDRKIASLYSNLEAQRRSNPSLKLGTEQLMAILAEVADGSGSSAAKMLTKMKTPGVTRDQQITMVKRNMTPNEKKDLLQILDNGTIPLEADARSFLEAVIDRPGGGGSGGTPGGGGSVGGFEVVGTQRDGFVGKTKANATIEAINISAAPSGRLHLDDTTVVGRADANGNFNASKLSGDQTMKEGDLIRMRARYADGTTSDWLTIKATGIDTRDTRNAEVALARIGLEDAGGGKLKLTNINDSRQISEPGAVLQFTNSRTNETKRVTLDAKGSFPANTTVNGRPGDTFLVAASDGINNTNFTTAVGAVTAGGGTSGTDRLPDPALHSDDIDSTGRPKFNKTNFTGPLFLNGGRPEDVAQGNIGDCYFPAAMAAIAHAMPDALPNIIRSNNDGTYTVTFKQRDWNTQGYKNVEVKVDGDLYVRSFGGPLYGRGMNSQQPSQMELWFPLIEKAYAQWKGGYTAIGNGGQANRVFEDMLGRPASSLTNSNPNTSWERIKKNIDAKLPIAAGTHGEDQEARYTNTGVYADHAYSIVGYEETNGQRYVKLRNPWGESEPAGNGPNDGFFKLRLEDFMKLYDNVMYVQ